METSGVSFEPLQVPHRTIHEIGSVIRTRTPDVKQLS